MLLAEGARLVDEGFAEHRRPLPCCAHCLKAFLASSHAMGYFRGDLTRVSISGAVSILFGVRILF